MRPIQRPAHHEPNRNQRTRTCFDKFGKTFQCKNARQEAQKTNLKVLAHDFTSIPTEWIETNFHRRECKMYLSTDVEGVCQCGRIFKEHEVAVRARVPLNKRPGEHKMFGPTHANKTKWTPITHSQHFNTDAYGKILMESEQQQRRKSNYIRLGFETPAGLITRLLLRIWDIDKPNLIISIQGGDNFELSNDAGRAFQSGIITAAKATNAWIFTNGLNTGVGKQVGNALKGEKNIGIKRKRVQAIGIAPWGKVARRTTLIGTNSDKSYPDTTVEMVGNARYYPLNGKHIYFLLVDDGTVGKFGSDIYLRKRLERHLVRSRAGTYHRSSLPVVALILNGDPDLLLVLIEYITDNPPVPVVIFTGTGGCADVVSATIARCRDKNNIPNEIRKELTPTLKRFFGRDNLDFNTIFANLEVLVRNQNLIRVFSTKTNERLDEVLIRVFFENPVRTMADLISMTILWDRHDIAKELFGANLHWDEKGLELAMLESLTSDREDFVNLILEQGLNTKLFVSIARLEYLYNIEIPQLEVLRIMVQKKLKKKKKMKKLTMYHIGLVINEMMGHLFKSKYTVKKNAEKFLEKRSVSRSRANIGKNEKGKKSEKNDDNTKSKSERRRSSRKSTGTGGKRIGKKARLISTKPFDDLFLWAVITKRHKMAIRLWEHGNEAMAKALVAARLNRYFAMEIISDELIDTSLAKDFETYENEWKGLALSLLDKSHKQNIRLARQILTMELKNWSKQNCLKLAVIANHVEFIGHPCSQVLLADLWSGAINDRSGFKIFIATFFPPAIYLLTFKYKEKLKITGKKRTRSKKSEKSVQLKKIGSDEKKEKEKDNKDKDNKEKDNKDKDKDAETVKTEKTGKTKMGDLEDQYGKAEKNNPEKEKLAKQQGYRYIENRKLNCTEKFWYFQKAPVTNFYRYLISYLIFLILLAFAILNWRSSKATTIAELYVVIYIFTLGLDLIRELLAIRANSFCEKWAEFRTNTWSILDLIFVLIFLPPTIAEFAMFKSSDDFDPEKRKSKIVDNNEVILVIYCITSIYWIVRTYKLMSYNRYLGPKLVMMYTMTRDIAYFSLIMLVIIISFGIIRQAIGTPTDKYSSVDEIARTVLMEPYYMFFGQMWAPKIFYCEPGKNCRVGYWLVPILQAIYVLMAMVLIINILIAVFNSVYQKLEANSLQLWLFKRYKLINEYEEKPGCPPPFVVICHIWLALKNTFLCVFCNKCCRKGFRTIGIKKDQGLVGWDSYEANIIIFLTKDQRTRVLDFEADCVGEVIDEYNMTEFLPKLEALIRKKKRKKAGAQNVKKLQNVD